MASNDHPANGDKVEEESDSDFMDLGLVELHSEESKDIREILSIKHTTKDKVTYTVFSMNIFLTCFLVGFCPKYFYLWHTVKCVTLISYRWYSYKKKRYHYFLFDFCYFTNVLILLYLWLPEQLMNPTVRGRLFTTCFAFANGPVLSGIVAWRNSLVPHSSDKMTSLFIHVSPAMALYGIRWFSTPDQGFPICSHQLDTDADCSDVGVMEILYYPILMYCAWQIFYIILVELTFAENVKKRDYATSYTFMVGKHQKGILVQLMSIFGPKYRKLVFILLQFVYTLLAMHLTYFSYKSMEFSIVVVSAVMAFASYNGATFYIDVFSHKYKESLKEKSK